ncbi:MAG: rubrerythrin family protein [Spirochaetes bacterium GWF1_31_7]|nr:MAG: rubrerythrin family protein [Spirochaetes bacterium GWE1_32_154]OHD49193.1 MAG: rubrerythrin family protein [Spirochaetes bacterium GWF1_31_7]OHD50415.1 MAG: rubrerythrin family protein [Spirochaetes bacterium GWE2_31_10]OHD76630.1 MAG: rubrerythrin family protein [Spirochaetes bacterium RIFOXYB1_FULL_32_8]HBD93953.1 rubrerythrin family protein [Spirochaetia bacterium]
MKNYIKGIQKLEIEGYHIYNVLSRIVKNKENAEILKDIAQNEREHYHTLRKYSGLDVKPSKIRIFIYIILARVLGLTFALKLMERGEHAAPVTYASVESEVLEVKHILMEEDTHEARLINMINEERLNYVGSIVLGLSDALVELTGALAGFTFAIQNTRTIAMIGLITGIAATLSMAGSEFLSQSNESEEDSNVNPVKSSIYTGVAYVVTVAMLVLPYFVFRNPFISLFIMLCIVLLIILAFTFYISVAKDRPFFSRFFQMASISLGVAVISFGIGYVMRTFFGLDI